MNLSDLRQNYTKGSFSEGDLMSSPFDQFRKWFREAQEAQIEEPNAMCLATYRANKCPNTRVVLLKDFSEKGLVFYTNYESRKAVDLETNPQAAANFLWLPLQRQVNVTGRVERIPKAESLLVVRLAHGYHRKVRLSLHVAYLIRGSRSINKNLLMGRYRFRITGVVIVLCRIPLSSGRAGLVAFMIALCIA
jgi:pyridoxine/pyridoxamine 5'-phosphate oxidase